LAESVNQRKPDQRREQRYKVSVPATVKLGDHTVAASTKDISASGLFLMTDLEFRPGSSIEIVLMLPKELGAPDNNMVCCHARIVRVEHHQGEYGIAAVIERMASMPQV